MARPHKEPLKSQKNLSKRIGRPRIEIDWEQVDRMCGLHCTGEEQASVLGIDYDTLNRACKREHKKSFAEYFKQKSASGKMSLRRKQYTSAMSGNTTLLIWLGKNWLGQKDQAEVTTTQTETIQKVQIEVIGKDAN